MEKITSAEELRNEILILEGRRKLEEEALRGQFRDVHKALKPANLLMSAIKDITSSPAVKTSILDAAMGMGAGLLSKKLLVGSTINPLKMILGNVIEAAVAVGVSKNSEGIKSVIGSVIQKILGRKEEKEEDEEKSGMENERN